MRYEALATDYDGTIAEGGKVPATTVAALKRFRQAGGTLVLNTGREVIDLQAIFPGLAVFHWIVAENGAVLHQMDSGEERLLGSPPSERFLEALQRRNVGPLYIGRVIVATYEEHALAISDAISESGDKLQVILNKGAAMILPEGCDKATGLEALYRDGILARETTVGVGDAENDLALLAACGLGVAVANALPSVKEKADWVMTQSAGDGVSELIERLLVV